MDILRKIVKIIVGIIPFLIMQTFFVLLMPITLFTTLYRTPDLLGFENIIVSCGGERDREPSTFKEWVIRWIDFTTTPYHEDCILTPNR